MALFVCCVRCFHPSLIGSFLPSHSILIIFFVSPIKLCVRTLTHCSCSCTCSSGPLGLRIGVLQLLCILHLLTSFVSKFCLIYSASWDSFLVCFAHSLLQRASTFSFFFLFEFFPTVFLFFCFLSGLLQILYFVHFFPCSHHHLLFPLFKIILYSAVRCSSCVIAVDYTVFDCF